ncbi:MAG: hypothetical protein RRY33_08665, partial [Alistipes sp.]
MKQFFFVLSILLLMSSCSSDTTTSNPIGSSAGFVLQMNSSNMITESWGTRSSAAEGVISFTAGDRIGIAGDNIDYAAYAVQTDGVEVTPVAEGSANMRWSGQPASLAYYAILPYSSFVDGVFSASIPAVQKIVNGINTTSMIAFGSGTCVYDGQTPPQHISVNMKPYSAMLELLLPGTGQKIKSLDIAPIIESELSGGLSFELTIATNGTSTVKSVGKSLRLEFKGDKGDFLILDAGKTIFIPIGEFSLAAGSGLRLHFTLEDGTTLTRTICAGEAFSSSTQIEGVTYMAHMTLQLASLDQLENVLYDSFGSQGVATPLESKPATSLYQLAK